MIFLVNVRVPLHGDMNELFRIVVNLCYDSYQWLAPEFEIIKRFQKIKKLGGVEYDDKLTLMCLEDLASQGYIYRVDESYFSILPDIKVME